MKKINKLLSVVLTFCIAISRLPGFAFADTEFESYPEVLQESVLFELPDIVDAAEARKNDYIGRVKSEEKDLNTFVFANGDGTTTMRVYSHPVKYSAADGSVRDISLDINPKAGGGFVTADHEIITTFARELSDGISLEYADIDISLAPSILQSIDPVASISSDNKTVTYHVDDATAFVYNLTYSGFKEDIVVSRYTGQTEYRFTLSTGGLALCEEQGSYYLADSEGNKKAFIGDIIVFTDDERNNTLGSMTFETVLANHEYILTIHLDPEYLSSEDTKYPIRIDPTISINYGSDGAGAIEDVTINERVTFGGTSGSLYIGRQPAGSLSRVLMRFPTLSLSGIGANQITAASVEIRDLMCQGDEDITIECRIYKNTAPAWSESGTTTWASVGETSIGDLLDSHLVSYGNGNVSGSNQRYSFNILNAAKAWASGTQSPAKGLVFKAQAAFENQTGSDIKCWYKTFSSYNRPEDYKPSLSITYSGSSGGANFENAETITLNSLYHVNIGTAGTYKYVKFVPSSTGVYSFVSSSATGDPFARLYNSSGEHLSVNDDSAGNGNFCLSYLLVSGVPYYFAAGCYNSGLGSYDIRIINANSSSRIDYSSVASLGTEYTISISTSQRSVCMKIVPTVTRKYLFYSAERTGDPEMWLYNSSFTNIGHNDDGAGSLNSRIEATLTAGSTYYLIARHHNANTGKYTLYTCYSADIPSGACYIKNIGSEQYVDIHGPDAQELVHQWTFHDGYQARWKIQRQSDGSYVIRSEYGQKKYIGADSTNITSDNIKLYTSVSSTVKWKIFTNSKGILLFEPVNAPGKALFAPNNSTHTELQLQWLSYSSSLRHKWCFEVRSKTTLEGQRTDVWCWAASARMLARHYSPISAYLTQDNAVLAIQGTDWDDGGSIYEAIQAVGYYRSEDISSNTLGLTAVTAIYSESNVMRFLNDGHVLYIARGKYNSNNFRISGHATVIVGYTAEYSNGSLIYSFVIYDPWPNEQPYPWDSPQATDGTVEIKLYQQICDENAGYGNTWVWEQTVAVATAYSSDTISPRV